MQRTTDVLANRKERKYTGGELVKRALWSLCRPFFSLSPRTAFGWRRFLLRRFGARVGDHVHIYNSAVIEMPWNLHVAEFSAIGERAKVYNLGLVTIGARTTVSQGAHLCAGTHDYSRPSLPLLRPPITIGNDVWVAADAFVGPGVNIGPGAVIGARAVVVHDVDAWTVVAGNPARFVKQRRLSQGEYSEAGG